MLHIKIDLGFHASVSCVVCGNLTKKASATVRVNLSSEKMSRTIQEALEPETKAATTYRSRVKLGHEGNVVTLFFEADDTTALRASMNSYLSWLKLLKDLCASFERQ